VDVERVKPVLKGILTRMNITTTTTIIIIRMSILMLTIRMTMVREPHMLMRLASVKREWSR